MRADDLGRSLLFGAVAALTWLLLAGVTVPLLGAAGAVELHAALALSAYTFVIASRAAVGLRAGLAVAAGCALASVLAPTTPIALFAMVSVFSVVRSAWLYRSRPLRAVVLELLLGAGGLRVAAAVASASTFGLTLGTWTFFLVQGLFFLAGGVRERPSAETARDAFDAARDRLERILEPVA